MQTLTILCLVVLVLAAWRAFAKDYMGGVAFTVAILVSCSEGIRLPMPGDLPEITVQRILLLIWLASYLSTGRGRNTLRSPLPMFPLLAGLLFTKFVSMCLSTHPGHSLKNWISVLLEQVIFYFLLYRSLQGPSDALRILKAAVAGLAVVAGISWIEYYTGYNVVAQMDPILPVGQDGIVGTFRHRILLGYGMAMACLLALGLAQVVPSGKPRRLYQVISLFCVAACYFAYSRGPWLGFGLGCVVLGGLGGRRLRFQLASLAVLALCVLVLRPGVWGTISSLMGSTFDTESEKGRSYSYRNELWGVAYHEIAKSPERLLFGYGGLSTEFMDLSDKFQYGGNAVKTGYTSWDSQYAADLIEFGFLGLALDAALYLCVLAALVRNLREAPLSFRELQAAAAAAVAVFLFALSNVWSFSGQINCLFWILVAASHAVKRANLDPGMAAVSPATDDSTLTGAVFPSAGVALTADGPEAR